MERPQGVSLTADGQVMKKVIKEGSGGSPIFGSIVSVHYKIILNDKLVEGSAEHRKKEYSFRLGSGSVPSAWEITLPTMKIGDVVSITAHHDYAFGKFGLPPHIPPQTVVTFEIELLSVTADPNDAQTFEQRLAQVDAEKAKGNTFVQSKNYRSALRFYQMALARLEGTPTESSEQKTQLNKTKIALFLNLSLCALRLEEPREAVRYCELVLQLDALNGKALFRCGQAYEAMRSYQKSLEFYQQAALQQPEDALIPKEIARVQSLIKSKAPDELLFSNMFRR